MRYRNNVVRVCNEKCKKLSEGKCMNFDETLSKIEILGSKYFAVSLKCIHKKNEKAEVKDKSPALPF